jgi:UDP-N-acetylmuramoylalanine--D-glutamate ligase
MRFLNQNIAIIGLGLEALDLVGWLKKQNKDLKITILDQKPAAELTERLALLKSFSNLHFRLGPNYLTVGLEEFDLIFRSPGVPYLLPQLRLAEQQGVHLSSLTKLFFELCPCPIIGVTGTKGKGTTASLITQILKTSRKKVYLAGNIGQPPLKLLDKLSPHDWVCLELSSFQLQGLNHSPHLAVVLNITREHLDYHRSIKEYRQAKTNILAYQRRRDLAVLNYDYPVSRAYAKLTPASIYWFSRRRAVCGSYVQNNKIYLNLKKTQPILIGPTAELLLRGEHNWENITAAIAASALAGASLKAIRTAVFQFKGLEHRLELVRTVKGVSFYNDSFSTTPETAIAALKSFTEPMIIILGGSEKASDYRQLGQVIHQQKNLKAIILIGLMAEKIEAAIERAGGFKGKIIRGFKTMTQIVHQAQDLTQKNEVVVLSPACASFDMFKNYKDRGDQFKTAVRKL